jgi:Fe-S-cluster containining protein
MSDVSPSEHEDSIDSPLGLAQEVEKLLKLPQSLCKQRGMCCKVATFKGSLNYEEIKVMAQGEDLPAEMARDFVSLFEPYPSQAAVREIAPIFVDRVREKAAQKGEDPDQVSFFKCRYVLADGRCGVHEDRPVGCRTYPFPHENTIYHPGCGFEKQGHTNWEQIKRILEALGMNPDLSSREDGPSDE